MEDSDSCMDSDCVNDISNATDSPQKKKRRLSEQHFLPAYTAEWPAVVRSKLDQFHVYANVTFRFAMAMAMARGRNFFPINAPGMGRFKLFNLVGYS